MNGILQGGPDPQASVPPDKLALLLSELDGDEDTWYVQLRAYERSLDPAEVLRQLVGRRNEAARLKAIAAPPPVGPTPPAAASAQAQSLPWPPGRAGTIARFLHGSSYSPIPEVAIAAALGLLAGVCGRAYRTPTGKDLALYIILVARSGVGKDAMHDGIPAMLDLANQPLASSFLRAQDFVSGEALHKELLREPGFLYLQGEFGRKLKRMSNPTDAPMQTFRTIMTNAFGKQYLEGKKYSNADDSLNGVEWPALSFLGETTPGTFLECLTPDMMQDGFLSRFLIVSYGGGKPPPNRCRDIALPAEDLGLWHALVDHTAKYLFPVNIPDAIVAAPDAVAAAVLDKFDDDCRDRLNATDDEAERPVWTRAHLKALKVACLLAVADNYLAPVVRREHAAWALGLVERDIEAFRSNQRNGNIGLGDDARERKLASVMRDYIVGAIPASYGVPPKMHKDGLVPRSYLQKRVQTLAAFSNHKLGVSKALDEALRSMASNGWVMECKSSTIIEGYGHHGKTYRVLDLPK